MAETQPAPVPKKSDLGVRAASAVVMLAVAGTALWLGGWVWTVFVAAIALGVLWEWWGLICGFVQSLAGRTAWILGGVVYVGLAALALVMLRHNSFVVALHVLLMVIAVDVSAYFSGRTIGGPKIAPKISPSKTWSGLIGGAIGATLVGWLMPDNFLKCAIGQRDFCNFPDTKWLPALLVFGALVAVVAQTGDFFESWLKRRAGVKDSSHLIPGHGGLFDRADGMLAVMFAIGLLATLNFTLRG